MNVITCKDGVQFLVIKPSGFRILAALQNACLKLQIDIVITSACDGCHSGVNDPHHRGEAYDVRDHDLTTDQKNALLKAVMDELGWDRFYGFLEAPGTDNEHIHIQVKKGTVYP